MDGVRRQEAKQPASQPASRKAKSKRPGLERELRRERGGKFKQVRKNEAYVVQKLNPIKKLRTAKDLLRAMQSSYSR